MDVKGGEHEQPRNSASWCLIGTFGGEVPAAADGDGQRQARSHEHDHPSEQEVAIT
jgi:hypothetical protein